MVTATINNREYPAMEKPLDCHIRGLMQTSTGYGSKLSTSYMVEYNNRMHRVYAICYSNCSTLYILVKGKPVYISSMQ